MHRADLDDEGSFDDAVAGCDYAFLVAAPVNLHSKDPEVHKRHRFLLLCKVIFTYSNYLVGGGRKN